MSTLQLLLPLLFMINDFQPGQQQPPGDPQGTSTGGQKTQPKTMGTNQQVPRQVPTANSGCAHCDTAPGGGSPGLGLLLLASLAVRRRGR